MQGGSSSDVLMKKMIDNSHSNDPVIANSYFFALLELYKYLLILSIYFSLLFLPSV